MKMEAQNTLKIFGKSNPAIYINKEKITYHDQVGPIPGEDWLNI